MKERVSDEIPHFFVSSDVKCKKLQKKTLDIETTQEIE